MNILNTRQIAARIRVGTLPPYSKGYVRCACHPDTAMPGDTEALKFWSKGMKIGCAVTHEYVPALAVFPEIGVTIDTRL